MRLMISRSHIFPINLLIIAIKVGAFCLLFMLLSAPLNAKNISLAKKHYAAGKSAFDQSNYQKALVEYQKAYKAAALPGFLFNIGQCYRNLKAHKKAVAAYESYLKHVPNAKNKTAVETLIIQLRAKIKQEEATKRALIDQPIASQKENLHPAVVMNRPDEKDRLDEKSTSSDSIFKKWWFWTIVGAVATGTGAAIYFGTQKSDPSFPGSPFPTWELP